MSTVKAVAVITGDPTVRGNLQFVQDPQGATHIRGKISGLSPGLHGFHIHSLGDTTNGCNSTGPHFNPLKKDHGAPSDKERHAGDLGNIVAGPDGVAEIFIKDMLIPLSGQHSILGRAVVVHANPDDLGRGIEVKPGSPYTCQLDPGVKLHISQMALLRGLVDNPYWCMEKNFHFCVELI